MVGADGAHPVFYGSSPLSGPTIKLAMDEDQFSDSERSHAAEAVAYFAIQ